MLRTYNNLVLSLNSIFPFLSFSLSSLLHPYINFDLHSICRHSKMYCLFFLGTLFAAVTLITSSPAGHAFYARQLPNEKNPRQYCGISIENGGCPADYPCKLEINPFTDNLQERCPCYGFCSSGYQICSNDLETYLAYKYCVSIDELLIGKMWGIY